MPLYRGIGDQRSPDVPRAIQVRAVMGFVAVNVASSTFSGTFPTFPALAKKVMP